MHLGDLGCKLPNDVAQALQNPDLLLLPVGGHYTIDAAQAVEVMEQLSPKTTVPMHYLVEDLRVEVAPRGRVPAPGGRVYAHSRLRDGA